MDGVKNVEVCGIGAAREMGYRAEVEVLLGLEHVVRVEVERWVGITGSNVRNLKTKGWRILESDELQTSLFLVN